MSENYLPTIDVMPRQLEKREDFLNSNGDARFVRCKVCFKFPVGAESRRHLRKGILRIARLVNATGASCTSYKSSSLDQLHLLQSL